MMLLRVLYFSCRVLQTAPHSLYGEPMVSNNSYGQPMVSNYSIAMEHHRVSMSQQTKCICGSTCNIYSRSWVLRLGKLFVNSVTMGQVGLTIHSVDTVSDVLGGP